VADKATDTSDRLDMSINYLEFSPDSSPSPTPKPGDTNGDGLINLTDLTSLLSNFGKSGTGIGRVQGDLNGDSSVNLSDLTELLSNFGK
jgi:hypothetical protein